MDDVLIARCDIKKGERILIENEEIDMKIDVKLGFKVASKAIIPEEKIIKFRTPITFNSSCIDNLLIMKSLFFFNQMIALFLNLSNQLNWLFARILVA